MQFDLPPSNKHTTKMGLEGILTVLATTLSAINRVPQVLFVYKNWSVTGINKTSLMLECWSYSIVISYSIYFNYSKTLITSYLPLLVQDTFMFYLIFKIESPSSNKELKRFIFASILIHSVICSKILPAWIPITILVCLFVFNFCSFHVSHTSFPFKYFVSMQSQAHLIFLIDSVKSCGDFK